MNWRRGALAADRYWPLRGIIATAFMAGAFVLLLRGVALPQDNPNCHEWGIAGGIPVQCCCSNNCCTEAQATEFEAIGNDSYRSTVTGQIVKRTGWSSGGYVKCACDLQSNGTWMKHPRANIRCLWVPMPSS